MFARISAALVCFFAAIFTVVTAAPQPTYPTFAPQCELPAQSCCDNVLEPDSSEGAFLLGQLNIDVEDISGLIGVNCVSVFLSSASCSAQPVCCKDNQFNGLVNLGCTPVDVSA